MGHISSNNIESLSKRYQPSLSLSLIPYQPSPSTMLTTHESISVAILVVYIPALFAAIAVAFRQGFTRSSGYVHLVIFCGLRIAGGVLEIISQKHPSNASDAEWAAIVSSIGLSPLLLASSGMLQRV